MECHAFLQMPILPYIKMIKPCPSSAPRKYMLTILIPSHNEGTKPNGSVQIPKPSPAWRNKPINPIELSSLQITASMILSNWQQIMAPKFLRL